MSESDDRTDAAANGFVSGASAGSGSAFEQAAAQRRWQEELERDRMAALMMKPGRGFPGPGAVENEGEEDVDEQPDESDDEESVGSDDAEGSGGGNVAKDAAEILAKSKGNFYLAAALFIKKHPLLTVFVVLFSVSLPLLYLVMLPIMALSFCSQITLCKAALEIASIFPSLVGWILK